MDRPLRILIVEDIPADAELLERELDNAGIVFTSERVDTRDTFVKQIEEFTPDIILSDYLMPQFDGMEALSLSKERFPSIPFIVVTGSINEETAVKCMKAGAADYLLKERLARIGPAIGAALERKQIQEEKEEAERALRESERALATLMSNLPGMAYRCRNDQDWTMEFVSNGCLSLTGYQPADLLNNEVVAFGQVIHPEDRDYVRNEVQKALAGKGHFEIEYRIITATGEQKWVWERGMEIPSDDKEPPMLEGLISDITARKLAKAELQRARQDWEDIFQAIGHPTMILDREHKIIAANRALIESTGKPHKEILGKRCFDIFHSSDAPPPRCPMEKSLNNGDLKTVEMKMEALGRTFLVSCTPIADEKGEVARVIHIATDITERKQAEEALQKSEKMYRDAIEVADSVPYYQNYLTSAYEFVGPGIESLIGYAPEEFTPGLWTSIIQEHILLGNLAGLSLEEAIQQARGESGISWRADCRVRTRSGEERWISNSAVQVRNEQGTVIGSLGILQDITERKNLEGQFLHSQKMEAIGRLAGGVAHDFNNVLMAVSGYSSLALTRLEQGDPLREDIEEIRSAGERGASLTRQLLAFSRRQILQPVVLDLNEVIANMEKFLRRLLGEDIDLITVCEPGLGRVKADPGQIEQVIMNLAVNARDAMPRGGKLTIETANVQLHETYTKQYLDVKPGPHVLMAVSDTGIGMDKETQSRIFEPFFTTKETAKGTGLGLATAYGIVKQSGGHIAVYSEPGQGTAFKVYFTRIMEAALPSKLKTASESTGGRRQYWL
ncbi:MAG: PAS domain S-box protein [bacterium]